MDPAHTSRCETTRLPWPPDHEVRRQTQTVLLVSSGEAASRAQAEHLPGAGPVGRGPNPLSHQYPSAISTMTCPSDVWLQSTKELGSCRSKDIDRFDREVSPGKRGSL